MTAYASLSSAVEALRRGAHDYLLKPLSLAALGAKVQRVAEYRALGRENARLRRMLHEDGEPASLIRLESRGMRELSAIVEKVAKGTSNVLIHGESGTGKELVARALHDLSERREQPFVSVNVSAIPENLVESYLFGHERGAFTGADERREGLFRAASGGTLFLDEIGELSMPVQAKLLRAEIRGQHVDMQPRDGAVGVRARSRRERAGHLRGQPGERRAPARRVPGDALPTAREARPRGLPRRALGLGFVAVDERRLAVRAEQVEPVRPPPLSAVHRHGVARSSGVRHHGGHACPVPARSNPALTFVRRARRVRRVPPHR